MSQELPFEPFPFIDTAHKQTIIGTFCNFAFDPGSSQKFVSLKDGDKLSIEITTPDGWKPTDCTVVMVHGLCGSHKSPYLVRLTKLLLDMGIRSVRVNLRGCGSGMGYARKGYHSGSSDDIFECLKVLKKENPASPTLLIGFSLGGNIVLKLAGELNVIADNFLNGVIAVSPPVDLYSSILLLGKEENSIYEKYFYKLLRNDVLYRVSKFKDLPKVRLPKSLKIYEFDQIYTAPMFGFDSALDYYSKCSASHVIEDIAIPCNVLLSEDDPIVAPSSFDKLNLPANVNVFKTKKGGHMGYLGRMENGQGFYWLDKTVIRWIENIFAS